MATAEHEHVTNEQEKQPNTEPEPASARNLEIWSKVCRTDPARTKKFDRAGGFKGTAINQTYQMQRATALWGPVGVDWGWKELETKIVEADGQQIWFTKVELFYPHHGKTGHVEHWGATTFCGKNKYGTFVDEEAAKKSVTDAVGKCLAMLGFSADVYLGLYDDNKYVNDMKAYFAGSPSGTDGGASAQHKQNGNGHQQQSNGAKHGDGKHYDPDRTPVGQQNGQQNPQRATPAQQNVMRMAAKAIAEAETESRVREVMQKARAVERGLTQQQIDEVDEFGKQRIGELAKRK